MLFTGCWVNVIEGYQSEEAGLLVPEATSSVEHPGKMLSCHIQEEQEQSKQKARKWLTPEVMDKTRKRTFQIR